MTAHVIDFYDAVARSFGWTSMAALEEAYLASIEAEMANDPQWKAAMNEQNVPCGTKS